MDEYDLRRLPAYQEKTRKLDKDEPSASVPEAPAELVEPSYTGLDQGE